MEELMTSPPLDDKSYENKLIALALAQVEKQLIEGTASSQTLSHFLKLGSIRSQVELEKIQLEKQLLAARIKSESDANKVLEVVNQALAALKSYNYEPPGIKDVDIY